MTNKLPIITCDFFHGTKEIQLDVRELAAVVLLPDENFVVQFKSGKDFITNFHIIDKDYMNKIYKKDPKWKEFKKEELKMGDKIEILQKTLSSIPGGTQKDKLLRSGLKKITGSDTGFITKKSQERELELEAEITKTNTKERSESHKHIIELWKFYVKKDVE